MIVDGVRLAEVARDVGTPVYVYSAASITARYREWRAAFRGIGFDDRHRTCFAVKANGALALLRHLSDLGSGFDIVSAGELERARAAGATPSRIIFSGPGKSEAELAVALRCGVGLINVESRQEAHRLARLAVQAGRPVDVGLRLNPDLDPDTHPSISTGPRRTKFGLSAEEIEALLADTRTMERLLVRAVAVHIGSQVRRLEPLVAAARAVRQLARDLRAAGHPVEWLDLGGGLAVDYERAGNLPQPAEYAEALAPALDDWSGGLITEPGRWIAAPAGFLLTRVLAVRRRDSHPLLVCDAGMNALLRPALYGAEHRVVVVERTGAPESILCDVVGPLCETGDVLARGVELSGAGEEALLAVLDVGAYGFVMASEYNAHPRPAQVWAGDGRWALLTARADPRQMLETEHLAPWQEPVGTKAKEG